MLAECRRLEAHPELYPNEELQQRFMEYVVTTVETLSKLQHILKKASEFTCRLRSEVPTEMSPHNVDGGIVGPAYRSKIHPHARTEKPQWSKWLGNDQTIVAGLNMASPVQQRFPTAALKILARHQSVYDKLEADFDVKSAVMRTQPKVRRIRYFQRDAKNSIASRSFVPGFRGRLCFAHRSRTQTQPACKGEFHDCKHV